MQRYLKNGKTPNTSKGITLVALAITIIVLLILAGVAINMAINSDGLFGKANEATEKWNESVENETDAIEDLLKEIGVINWEKAKAEAVAPASQVSVPKTTIGIDAKGEVVNMDLWKFHLDTLTGGYGLQDTIAFTTTASADIKALEQMAGYSGDFTNVCIPQYISTDNGETWTAVTNLDWTFYQCTELTQIDNIPDTVVSMRYTFRECNNLSQVGELPKSLNNMRSAFFDCASLKRITEIPSNVSNIQSSFRGCVLLEVAPKIPESVTNMYATFAYCKALEKAPEIPNGVTNMFETFYECESLKFPPTNIPSSVENMNRTFAHCPNLTGNIVINANITGKLIEGVEGETDYMYIFYESVKNENCKLTIEGSCPMLQEIITHSNNANITLKVTQ